MLAKVKNLFCLFNNIVQTRLALAKLELIEARVHLLRLFLLSLLSLLFLLLFLFTSTALLVFLLHNFFSVEGILLWIALTYLALMFCCIYAIFFISRKKKSGYFVETLTELKKDYQILQKAKQNDAP